LRNFAPKSGRSFVEVYPRPFVRDESRLACVQGYQVAGNSRDRYGSMLRRNRVADP
jgi:hypothetical protein